MAPQIEPAPRFIKRTIHTIFAALLLTALLAACQPAPDLAPIAVEAETIGEGAGLLVLVKNLGPGERVTAVGLLGPEGTLARAETIWHGRREIGGIARPGVGLEGSSSRGVGLSLDLVWPPGPFFDRKAEVSGFAEARLPLADPAVFTAAPQDFSLEIRYRDIEGRERRLLVTAAEALAERSGS